MPFGPYATFDECVRDNADKRDPEAYCSALERELTAGEFDWYGVVTIEGEATGDARMLALNSLVWPDEPMSLLWDREEGDHTGQIVGSVDHLWRVEDEGRNLIVGAGRLSDSDDPATRAAVNRVRELLTEGAVQVSVSLDDVTVELQVPADLAPETIVAAVVGDVDLPVAERSHPWSAAAARNRVWAHATDADGNVDFQVLSRAFLLVDSEAIRAYFWEDDDGPLRSQASWQLGYVDVIDGRLVIVPRGVRDAGRKAESATDGDQLRRVQSRICRLHARVQESSPEFDDCPWDEQELRETVMRHRTSDLLSVTTRGRIRHLALVDTAAFEQARIRLVPAVAAAVASPQAPARAAAAFINPAFGRDGFDDPRLTRQEPERPGERVTWGCPLTVTDDGKVFGHACLWGRCHAGFRDRCVVPPRGGDYSRFLSGEAVTGVRTGPITVGTTHAGLAADARAAMDHYSDTGRAVADVTVGEDDLGLWVAGRLRPGVTEADVAALRGSTLSGDWRPVNGKYRLCGLLAVNQPGYLVQRASENAVITAGPCSCDDVDPVALLFDELRTVKAAVAVLMKGTT